MKKKPDLAWLKNLTVPSSLDASDYEYAGDRDALKALKAVPGAGWVFSRWVEFWLEFRRTGFLGSTVKVGPKQFPELNALRVKAAELLCMKPPPLFVVEQPMINAFTMGTDQDNSFVAITRPLLEAATEKELLFILGHEFGHIKSQHALYATIAIYLANMGLFYGYRVPGIHLLAFPLEIALKAWFRRSEITCDRAGLVCVQDLDSARRALLLLGCCSRELADRIDLDEFRRQSAEVAGSYGKWSELFVTHPYLPKRIRCLETFAGGHLYVRRVKKDRKSEFLDPDDLDAAVGDILGNEEPTIEKTMESSDLSRLKAALAFAGAWAAGPLTPPLREDLSTLLVSLRLKPADLKRLRGHLQKPLTITRALHELRYFTGDRLRALPYFHSFLLRRGEGVSFAATRALSELSLACGLSALETDGAVFETAFRKRLFRERAGTDLCASCAHLVALSSLDCTRCGTPTTSLETPDGIKVKRLGDRIEEVRRSAQALVSEAAGGLLGLIAQGIEAGAAGIRAAAAGSDETPSRGRTPRKSAKRKPKKTKSKPRGRGAHGQGRKA
ncbi:MAG: hypothetical protein AUJ52_09910 [Elusimicrobia bacterium CG1_02_63_36]|nr:MAG: hypothetical protein AUJ52_09910 [Elusimicrobia bacterium CG1_02_63_36]PIP84291.1 MAG: hypothetical protein COR54_04910 [Elusimicrobia bacterium CG22_combo_CG10-13_8_21_14_all_63_91]PJA15660.1 MAG: hypothetical protein COX66_09480 [Elusimicrobia bacterium CG_4_10_14_0_2_um_filter_63_34]PJB23702.1 MAG: hypothetical protein CO113_17295 [Elusimicrobia bacterium CG_4_9_14_3_um_filter_62_55]